MIIASHLTKHYGDTVAVDDLSFTVQSGRVTGFLGPNGAGKSTTMRMALGLDAPTEGSITINGLPYQELMDPLRTVGTLLDPKAAEPKRSARDHLRWLAASNGIERRRVDDVLELVGRAADGERNVGGFSLGMQQRLGLAVALLGDPETLLLDEPINGLDPEGILWMRTFVRSLADEGRTVFLSSHLMAEMAQTADHLIVIGNGRLIADAATTEILETHAHSHVRVRTVDRQDELAALLAACGVETTPQGPVLLVSGVEPAAIGTLAASAGIALAELTAEETSLEEAFLELTHRSTIQRAGLIGAGRGAHR